MNRTGSINTQREDGAKQAQVEEGASSHRDDRRGCGDEAEAWVKGVELVMDGDDIESVDHVGAEGGRSQGEGLSDGLGRIQGPDNGG
ncbi:hypothetical protein PO909_022411 [Leuciscus waleckii]